MRLKERMNRLVSVMLVLGLLLAACGGVPEAEPEESETETDPTDVTAEPSQGEDTDDESEDEAIATTLISQEDDAGVLEVATLLPVESGLFEGSHWIKWKLATPIPDPPQFHVTYQVTLRSAEDDIYGVGWTIPLDGASFASGFCLDDRPNCADGTVSVAVDVSSERDELVFLIPEGTFGDATMLDIGAVIQTYATPDASPDTENVGDGARVPLGTTEGDPC